MPRNGSSFSMNIDRHDSRNKTMLLFPNRSKEYSISSSQVNLDSTKVSSTVNSAFNMSVVDNKRKKKTQSIIQCKRKKYTHR